jgi:predicted dithiol-disulfide oxidoreductase (DUF899 family)
MGWSIPWSSSANTDFSFDLGASLTVEQTRANMPPNEGDLPPIAPQNAAATGTDLVDYIAEVPAASAGAVYQTYATTWRGGRVLMGYYPILDPGTEGSRRARWDPALDPPAR